MALSLEKWRCRETPICFVAFVTALLKGHQNPTPVLVSSAPRICTFLDRAPKSSLATGPKCVQRILSLFLIGSLALFVGGCRGEGFERHERFRWNFEPEISLESYTLEDVNDETFNQKLSTLVKIHRSDPLDQSPLSFEWEVPPPLKASPPQALSEDRFLLELTIPRSVTFEDYFHLVIIASQGSRSKKWLLLLKPREKTIEWDKADEKSKAKSLAQALTLNVNHVTASWQSDLSRSSALREAGTFDIQLSSIGLPEGYPLQIALLKSEATVFSLRTGQTLTLQWPYSFSRFEPDPTTTFVFLLTGEDEWEKIWILSLERNKESVQVKHSSLIHPSDDVKTFTHHRGLLAVYRVRASHTIMNASTHLFRFMHEEDHGSPRPGQPLLENHLLITEYDSNWKLVSKTNGVTDALGQIEQALSPLTSFIRFDFIDLQRTRSLFLTKDEKGSFSEILMID